MSNSVNLALDVTKTGIQNPLIKVRQGDGGFETLHTTVTSNGEPLDLQGWTITFMGTTAGNHKIVDANVNIVEAPNGIFDYTPSKAWGIDIGEFKIAYFKFVKGDGSASSANFRVNVIEAVDLTQEEAQNYISVVDNLIEQTRQDLTNSLADVNTSIAATSSAASSMAVYVSSTADSAVNKVEATTSNAVNTINATASSAVSQVNSAASSASSVASSAIDKVSGVATQVNSLSIGGRNYLRNSSGDSLSSWSISDPIWSVTADTTRGNVFTSTPTVSWTGGGTNSIVQTLDKKLIGSQVTVSFWAKTSIESANFHSEPQGGSVTFSPKLTTSWARYYYTIPNFSGTVYFMAVDVGTTYYIDDIKLEIGNVATDWTPSPEDAPSNDAQLVHKTGTETIAGDKMLIGKTTANDLVSNGVPVNAVKSTTSTMWYSSTLTAHRNGSMVTIVNNKQDASTIPDNNASTETIPLGYRPATVLFYPVVYGASLKGELQINVNGTFTARGPINGQYRLTATYVTSDAWPV